MLFININGKLGLIPFFCCCLVVNYSDIIFSNFLTDKTWNIVLQITKHSRNFLLGLRFRIHSWCADPWHFPVAWSSYFTFSSPYWCLFTNATFSKTIKIFMMFFTHSKRLIKFCFNYFRIMFTLYLLLHFIISFEYVSIASSSK